MKLIIDISENVYNLIKRGSENRDFVYKSDLMRSIADGILLPKGHGDLIDRKSILCDDCSCEQCGHTDECFKLLAPTVINADNEAD